MEGWIYECDSPADFPDISWSTKIEGDGTRYSKFRTTDPGSEGP